MKSIITQYEKKKKRLTEGEAQFFTSYHGNLLNQNYGSLSPQFNFFQN